MPLRQLSRPFRVPFFVDDRCVRMFLFIFSVVSLHFFPTNFVHLSDKTLCKRLPTNRQSDVFVRPSIRPSIRPSVHPSVHPSVRPSVHPSVCPSVRPFYATVIHQSIRQILP